MSHADQGWAGLTGPARAVLVYYLATPAFAVLDLAFGINVRAAFLDGRPVLKLVWYALALVCAAAVARWPNRAGLVGLAESGASIALLVIGTMTAYLAAVDAAASESAAAGPPFRPADVVNLMVSSGALIVSYIAAQARASREGLDDPGLGGRGRGRL